jgi:hypothetical protein
VLHTSHYQFAGGFTVEEERRIGVLVGSSITMGSSDDYSRHWKKWLDFLGTIEVERRPQEYLEDVGEVGAKVKWLVLFIDYLKNVVRTQDVGGVLSGVKFQWKRRCLDCDFFKNGAVAQAKQGARLTTDQIRETALRKERTKILPAIVEMVIYLRNKLWRQSGVDRKGLDQKGTYMALAISFDSGLRPCNVTLRDGPRAEDHCVRAHHFRFLVELERGKMKLSGGEEIRAFLMVDLYGRMAKVLCVDIMVFTGKNQNRASFSQQARTIGRGNLFEAGLLEDILEWMAISGVKAEDEFVTRYVARAGGAPGAFDRKVVTPQMVREAVKEACVALNLPPKRYSAKSLRSGFATHMTTCDISREAMVTRAGWSIRSRVPEAHYVSSFSGGAFEAAVGSEGEVTGMGLEGAWRLLPPGSGPSVR